MWHSCFTPSSAPSFTPSSAPSFTPSSTPSSTPSLPQMRALHCRLTLAPNASVWGFSRSQTHSSPQTQYHKGALPLCRRPPLSRVWSKGGSLPCSKSETMGVSLFANRRSLATKLHQHSSQSLARSASSPVATPTGRFFYDAVSLHLPLSRIWSKGGSLPCSKSETMGVFPFSANCCSLSAQAPSPPTLIPIARAWRFLTSCHPHRPRRPFPPPPIVSHLEQRRVPPLLQRRDNGSVRSSQPLARGVSHRPLLLRRPFPHPSSSSRSPLRTFPWGTVHMWQRRH
jgi:hypothetical protein